MRSTTFSILASVCIASPLAAKSPLVDIICDDTSRMVKRLSETLTSQRTGQGLRDVDQVVELWTDHQGDWMLVSRYATGTSCIIAMGAHWQARELPPS